MSVDFTPILPVSSCEPVAIPQVVDGIAVLPNMVEASQMQNAQQPSQEAIDQFQRAMQEGDDAVVDAKPLPSSANTISVGTPFVQHDIPEVHEAQRHFATNGEELPLVVESEPKAAEKYEFCSTQSTFGKAVNYTVAPQKSPSDVVAAQVSQEVSIPAATELPEASPFAATAVVSDASLPNATPTQEKPVVVVQDAPKANTAPATQDGQKAEGAVAVASQSVVAPTTSEPSSAQSSIAVAEPSETPVIPADGTVAESAKEVEHAVPKSVKAPVVESKKNNALEEHEDESSVVVSQASVAIPQEAPRVIEAAPLAAAPIAVHEVDGASGVANARSAELVEAAEAVCSAIMVSDGLSKGEGEIRIQLKADVLGGSDIRLAVNGSALSITFDVVSDAVQQLVQRNLPQFEQHLAQHIHAYQIAVDIIKRKVQK